MNDTLISIFIKNITVNNIVLYSLLGICPLILYQLSIKECLTVGIITTAIMLISTWFTMLIHHFLIIPLNLSYLKIFGFIIITYLIIELIKTIINKLNFPYAEIFNAYPEFFQTNFAIYGTAFLNINSSFNFLNITVNTLGVGVGYLILLLIFNCIKERFNNKQNLSRTDRLLVDLVILGLISLVFVGAIGLK